MRYPVLSILFVIISMSLAFSTYAASHGIGGVAQNIIEPVSLFSDFLQTACFIIGASFVFASIVKYFEHRRSPLMVPISTVVFLFIAGVVLFFLPFISYLSSSGIHYSLLKKS